MHIRRKMLGGVLAGMALIALTGCYPYYYDFHYSHQDGRQHGGYQGKHNYHGGGHSYYQDRYKRDRHRRYRHRYYRHY